MDDERLRHRIVLGLDALPVAPPPARQWWRRARPGMGGFSRAPAAVAIVAALTLLVAAPLVFSGAPATQAKPSPFADDFSTGLDRTRWNAWGTAGTSVTALDGRVELAIPALARATDGYISATLYGRCVARGDYDVSLDYTLLEWPTANGTQIAIGEFAPGTAAVTRNQRNGYETYGMFAGDSASARTVDMSGSLRLVRRGTKVTGSHHSTGIGQWVETPVQMTSQFDATFQVFLFSGELEFGGRAARVAVDNFALRGDQVICPSQ